MGNRWQRNLSKLIGESQPALIFHTARHAVDRNWRAGRPIVTTLTPGHRGSVTCLDCDKGVLVHELPADVAGSCEYQPATAFEGASRLGRDGSVLSRLSGWHAGFLGASVPPRDRVARGHRPPTPFRHDRGVQRARASA